MNKNISVAIVVGVLIVSGALFYVGGGSRSPNTEPAPITATIDESGQQIIDITARGGYSPKVVSAKAGIPTTLRVVTKETYDCSVSLVIPKLKYQKFLSSSGVEEIQIPAEKAKGTLNGLCSMGMYSFKIVFQ